MGGFRNRVVFITGASRGIGLATAKAFAANGALVVGTYHMHKPAEVDGIRYMHVDISDAKQCAKVIGEIYSEYQRIDVLVNNAGITADALTKRMTDEQFDSVLGINLRGTFHVTRLIAPQMQQQGAGAIVNIASIVGEYGNIGQANYAASKAGVIAMTKTWAREFAMKGGNVRVNAVAPGCTMTDMLATVPKELLDRFASQTMLNRLAQPEEIASAILFLASDAASYITGTVLDVNGGMRL